MIILSFYYTELPSKPVIFDEYGKEISGIAGPYNEGGDFKLICSVNGGKYLYKCLYNTLLCQVTWYILRANSIWVKGSSKWQGSRSAQMGTASIDLMQWSHLFCFPGIMLVILSRDSERLLRNRLVLFWQKG